MRLLIFSVLLSVNTFAQMPDTDIWLFEVKVKDGKYSCKKPLNITKRKGYDNQPSFSDDGKSIYFVSSKYPNQTDIFNYNIKRKTINPICQTRESEYSPLLIPNTNNLSTVTVEVDSTQHILQTSLIDCQSTLLIPEIDSVGYYTWLNKDTLLYYKLTNPHSLRAIDLITQKDVWICDNPTRSFKKINNSNSFIYGIKDTASVVFRIYNPTLKESKEYATYPSTNEDFIWHNELGLIKSEGIDLLRYNEKLKTWEVLVSFANLGIHKITRFTFDSKTKYVAIVDTE